ncbi:MAG: hypothetical protein ACAH83_03980 [Alphaproteobacteria bacterium]
MAALTQEEVQKMHDALKAAFDAAARNWNGRSCQYDSNDDKRCALAELSAGATALLTCDERLREMEQTASVTKLSQKMPGKD